MSISLPCDLIVGFVNVDRMVSSGTGRSFTITIQTLDSPNLYSVAYPSQGVKIYSANLSSDYQPSKTGSADRIVAIQELSSTHIMRDLIMSIYLRLSVSYTISYNAKSSSTSIAAEDPFPAGLTTNVSYYQTTLFRRWQRDRRLRAVSQSDRSH